MLRGVDGEPHMGDDPRAGDLAKSARFARLDGIGPTSVVVSAGEVSGGEPLLRVALLVRKS